MPTTPVVQSTVGTSGGSLSQTSASASWPAATKAGNTLVAILVAGGSSANAPTFTTPSGWTAAVAQFGASAGQRADPRMAAYIITGAAVQAAGSSVLVGFSGAAATYTLFLYELDATVAATLDQTATTDSTTAALTLATGTTPALAGSADFAIGAVAQRNNPTFSGPTNSFVIDRQATSGAPTLNAEVATAVVTKSLTSSAGAGCSVTSNISNDYTGMMLAFAPPSGGTTQTMTAGKVSTPSAVRGAGLTPGPATLTAGHVAGPNTLRGGALVPAAPGMSEGHITSPAAVRGADLTPGPVTLLTGHLASPATVRGGGLQPAPVALTAGKVASDATVRGALLGSFVPLQAGKVTTALVVRGGTLAPGAVTLAGGQVLSPAAVHGARLTPGAVVLTAGPVPSALDVRGGQLLVLGAHPLAVQARDQAVASVQLAEAPRMSLTILDASPSVTLAAVPTASVALADQAPGSVVLDEIPT